MIATEITDHVQQALGRLMEQYKDYPLITGIITAFVDQIQDLEDGIFPLDAGRQLENAVGVQLDELGTLLDLARNGASDSVYMLFLLGKAYENTSRTNIQTLDNICADIFQGGTVVIFELFPAGIAVQVAGTDLPAPLYAVAGQIIQGMLGAGIELGSLTTYDPSNVFTFSSINSPGTVRVAGQGFGSIYNPSEGGGFVSLSYTAIET